MKIELRAWNFHWAALALLFGGVSARANVYATDIKLNGLTNNAAIGRAGTLQISYILNEPATSNVLVEVLSGTNVVWCANFAGGGAGTAAGSNSVSWNGMDTNGNAAGPGIYQVSVAAAAFGHNAWTNITDDGINFSVEDPSGITVNKNTNSPYYGRVFVGNAPPPASGDEGIFTLGIYKYNADGSPADEGGFSTGGYAWGAGGDSTDNLYSPWKMCISGDDKLYVNDWSGNGMVLAFDEGVSTNNYTTVLGPNNYPPGDPGASLGGLWVAGAGTNTLIWMTDSTLSSIGVVEWGVSTNYAVSAANTGTNVVGMNTNAGGMGIEPYDLSVDTNGNLYVIQSLDGVDNTNYAGLKRLFCYSNHSGALETNPVWSIGSVSNELEYAYGVAVDPAARHVAVAVRGYGPADQDGGFVGTNGSVMVFDAAGGGLVARLDGDSTNDFIGVAWDNVGNLYATDLTASVWRAYSPPGANQATTPAVPVIQVYEALAPPVLVNPIMGAGQIGFTLDGQSNVTYTIEFSADLSNPANWGSVTNSYDIVNDRSITVPVSGNAGFYRAVIR